MNAYIIAALIAFVPSSVAAVASLRNGQKASAINSSLHNTNGGGNVKDALDRIEWQLAGVQQHSATTAASLERNLAHTAEFESYVHDKFHELGNHAAKQDSERYLVLKALEDLGGTVGPK